MTVTKRPSKKSTEKSIEKFIASAPDATPAPQAKKPLMRGKREQISHTIPPALLARLDKRIEATGMTRAGFINQAIAKYLDGEGA
jgi:predicted DNA-binding protein